MISDGSTGRCGSDCMSEALVVSLALVGIALIAACGRRGLPDIVPVAGRVTFAGGECPAAGCVFFLPAGGQPDVSATTRSGWARFERDGRYRATTLVQHDGLLPGTYDVRVACSADGGGPTGHDEGTSHVLDGLMLPQFVVPPGTRGPLAHDIDIVVPTRGTSGDPNAGVRSHAPTP